MKTLADDPFYKELLKNKEFKDIFGKAIANINTDKVSKAIENYMIDYLPYESIIEQALDNVFDDMVIYVEKEVRKKLGLPETKNKVKR